MLLTCCPSAQAQPIPGSAAREFRHFGLRHYTLEDGLPGESGYNMLIDRDGTLWLGSSEGLIRFDGRRFELFDSRSEPAMATHEVFALSEDGEGGLLIAMAGGQLLAGRPGDMRRVGYSTDRLFAVRAFNRQVLTCGVSGIHRWLGGQPAVVVRLPDETHCFETDGDDRWLALSIRSAVLLQGDRVLARRDDLGFSDAREIRAHLDGDRIWLWDDTQLLEWTPAGATRRHSTPPALRRCQTLVRDLEGTLWCASNKAEGLARSSTDPREMKVVTGSVDHVMDLAVDRAGGLWLWTWGHGLYRMEAGPVRLIGSADGVGSIAFIRPGRDDSVMLMARDGAWRWQHDHPEPLPDLPARKLDDRWLSYVELANGIALLGSSYGLHSRSLRSSQEWQHDPTLERAGVYTLMPDGDGVLIGSDQVHRWTSADSVELLQAGMPVVYSMVRDRAGLAYAATRDGIWQQRPDGGFERVAAAPAPTDRAFIVMSALRDRRDHLWFGGYESGLWRYDGKHWLHLSTADGLPSDTAYGLVDDESGRIWISHGRGLYTLNPKEVDALKAAGQRLDAIEYTRADGLPSERYNGGSSTAAIRQGDGSLWFASDDGAVQIDPRGWPRVTPMPTIGLRRLEIDGQAWTTTTQGLNLAPGTQNTRVQIQAPSLGAADRIELGWRLQPGQPSYRNVPADGWIELPRLSPGSLHLEVAAKTDGIWRPPWRLSITQLAPWYLMPWFWAAGIGLLFAAIVVLWRWRMRALHGRNAALEALVAERGSALAAEQNRALQADLARREAERELHFRRLADAREIWSQLDAMARVVLAAVAQSERSDKQSAAAALAVVQDEVGGYSAARVDSTLTRLGESGLLLQEGATWRLLRSEIALLPETQRPLVQLAREQALRIGAYRLLDVIGRGGHGEVYRAQNVHDGSPAAVKLLDADPLLRQDALRRLTREGEIVAQLRHPHIVRLLERGEQGGRVYLAMELVEGETLARYLQRGPLSSAECLRIARELASALATLHAAGVVHRDVNPNNIMIDRGGRSVLLDFGLARGHRHSTLTRPQTLLGTLPYMAPEQLRGEDAGPAADVWAFGVVCAEMLTGRLPWRAEQTIEMAVEVGAYRGWNDYPAIADTEWQRRLHLWLAPAAADRPRAEDVAKQLGAVPQG